MNFGSFSSFFASKFQSNLPSCVALYSLLWKQQNISYFIIKVVSSSAQALRHSAYFGMLYDFRHVINKTTRRSKLCHFLKVLGFYLTLLPVFSSKGISEVGVLCFFKEAFLCLYVD